MEHYNFSSQIPGTPSCTNVDVGTITSNYLNNKTVQKAIFAKEVQWNSCADLSYDPNAGPMLPYYEAFFELNPKLQIMIFSGDIDIATVPFPFTMTCLQELNRPVTSDWGPWFVNGATVGYVETFDRYTYATVKGAGHEVPLYQPLNAFHLFSRFIANQDVRGLASSDHNVVSDSDVPQRQGHMLRKLRQFRPLDFI